MHSNSYTIGFVGIMTTVVAGILALMFSGLKPIHDTNEALYNKKEILGSIKKGAADLEDSEVATIFTKNVKQFVLDANGIVIAEKGADKIDMKKEKKKPEAERKYPLYVYDGPEGKHYIVAVRGKGLWDEIWGSIAIKEDFNTIGGVAFNHTGETPGLGAEIKDNNSWKSQFVGKKLFNEAGEFVSVDVVKGGIKIPNHQVDGISGATVTAVGVAKMLDKGIRIYLPYFKKLQNTK